MRQSVIPAAVTTSDSASFSLARPPSPCRIFGHGSARPRAGPAVQNSQLWTPDGLPAAGRSCSPCPEALRVASLDVVLVPSGSSGPPGLLASAPWLAGGSGRPAADQPDGGGDEQH